MQAEYKRISRAREVRGIYAHDDEEATYLRQGWPKFESKEACEEFVRKCCRSEPRSNPDRRHMTQMITTLVNWEQVQKYILEAREEYNARWPPRAPTSEEIREKILDKNIWTRDVQFVDAEVKKRLSIEPHCAFRPGCVETTLKYLFWHMRNGIYVMIRANRVCIFAPFVNEEYQNMWGDRLQIIDNLDIGTYYQEKRKILGGRKEYVLESKRQWWANGNIICNEHSSKGLPAHESNLWGDRFVASLRDMLDEACKQRIIPDCEFFMNKRDYPQLKFHCSTTHNEFVEPYSFVVDGDDRDPKDDVTLPRIYRVSKSWAPVTSFYCSDRFADIPWPPSEDWEAAVGLILPPSFDYELDPKSADGITLDAKPRDLFTEANFAKFDCPWEQKQPTAFFRGTATGGGTTIADNQRLALAALSYKWQQLAALPHERITKLNFREKAARQHGLDLLLDAALVGWNKRDKKLGSKPMSFVRPDQFDFQASREHFTPIYDQSRYKYLIYVEGHCAACRYGFMMRLGSVILKVESKCVADKIWFFPLLKPYIDHIPVRADLTDLADKIRWCRENDTACRAIANNAKQLWKTYVSKEGLLDYIQLVTTRIAANFWYPAMPFLKSSLSNQHSPPTLIVNDLTPGCLGDEICARCNDDSQRRQIQTIAKEKRDLAPTNSLSSTVKVATKRAYSDTAHSEVDLRRRMRMKRAKKEEDKDESKA
uniref:Glycosyl transferase CAP10 domain-containing protein n=1 Tax=Aureoumbra lagunensis TaxID=44058 RepID=A0A7S3JW67_9STRA|mmetsp:Transcript_1160/g.1696  ORF Transcript_1160/g.1696 Transcript_1160/m.1696 type:complete len:710 (+) Transcript_1160:21-2150(+)